MYVLEHAMMRHSHLLYYIPYHMVNVNDRIFRFQESEISLKDMVINKLIELWYETPYLAYLNDQRPVCPICVETISTKQDSVSVSRYSSGELPKFLWSNEKHRDMNDDVYFFIP